MRYHHLPCLALAGLLIAGSARADSLRCGSRLVSSGDSLYKVRSVCGEPDAASRRIELRTLRRYVTVPCPVGRQQRSCSAVEEYTVEIVIDEWTYDFGSNRFIQYVFFEQGVLSRVESGSYGEKDPS